VPCKGYFRSIVSGTNVRDLLGNYDVKNEFNDAKRCFTIVVPAVAFTLSGLAIGALGEGIQSHVSNSLETLSKPKCR
jgi:hypothetical protein